MAVPPTLLVFNQYYPPDRAATGQLLQQLAESLAGDFDVHVICGSPSYGLQEGKAARRRLLERGILSGVHVWRLWSTRFGRRRLGLRALNYVSYLVMATLLLPFLPRARLVLVQTDPPFVGLLGVLLRWWRGGSLVFVCQDVFPEIAVATGSLRGPSVRLLRAARRRVLSAAAAVVAISGRMAEILRADARASGKVRVISNWADAERMRPGLPAPAARRELGLPEQFTLMHAGNLGVSQELELLLDLAWYLSPHDVQLVVAGDGARRAWLAQQMEARALRNVRLLPYQPLTSLPTLLAAGDVHLVTLKRGLDGLIFPSKVHNVMALARPLLCAAAAQTELFDFVAKNAVGTACEPRPKHLAQALLELKRDPQRAAALGRNGRRLLETEFSRQHGTALYKELLREVMHVV